MENVSIERKFKVEQILVVQNSHILTIMLFFSFFAYSLLFQMYIFFSLFSFFFSQIDFVSIFDQFDYVSNVSSEFDSSIREIIN